MSPIRVLVVEDEAIIRMVLSEILGEHGFEVVQATNTVEAARLLAAQKFGLLLTDLRLPGTISGVELALLAREHDAAIPVIVASGYVEDARAQLGGMQPPAVIVSKPYKLDDIASLALQLTAAP